MEKQKLDYNSYLRIDEILEQQHPISAETGSPAHIEMLYIIVHQAYELWFKSILHELDSVIEMFEGDKITERNMGEAVARLRRVTSIQDLLLQQVGVLETMTPLEFLDFRKLLGTASGFQSFQFRLLENKLGLLSENRIEYGGKKYFEEFEGEKREQLLATEKAPSLFSVVEAWLERTPFLHLAEFKFEEEYLHAADKLYEQEAAALKGAPDEERRTAAAKRNRDSFHEQLQREKHAELQASGKRRLSHAALLAALFIKVYRDEPILQQPFMLLERVVEIDENLARWRYRHAIMVHRMLGRKMGTGSSSGFDYLHQTADRCRIFTDFFDLSTLLLSRDDAPELPISVREKLGFQYQAAE